MAFHLKKNKQYMRENRNHLRACCLIGITMQWGSCCWLASLPACPGSLHLIGHQRCEHLSPDWPKDNPFHV